MSRPHYEQVLADFRLLERLAGYSPTIIGTPPLGIATESSDIDIACSATDLDRFTTFVGREFADESNLVIERLDQRRDAAVRAAFIAQDWEIELWCQELPVQEQWGVRHFYIEQRLLDLIPGLRAQVLKLKQSGVKTEPAFAAVLGLQGDPYAAMLELERRSDRDLLALQR